MAQEIYHRSEWGNPNEQWGNVYLNADLTNELYKRASEYENSWVTDQLLNGVGTKPSIIMTPTAYEDGLLNSVKPKGGENLLPYSEDFSQSVWTKNDVLIESGYTAPDGNNTAYKVTDSGSNGHLVMLSSVVSSLDKHKSIWARTVSGTGTVQLLNHNSDTSNIFTLTTQWKRFDLAHASLSHFYAVDFRGASTTLSEVILWGAQLERGSKATTYIPTNGTAYKNADFDFTRGSSATRVNEQGLIQDVQILSGELVQNGDFEQIGSELVTNGDFATDSDWTKIGTTISNGQANFVNASAVALYQNVGTQTTFLKVTFEVTQYTSGVLKVYSGSNQNISNADLVGVNLEGLHTIYIPRSGTNGNIIFGSSSGEAFTGSIDNVSVKEVGQNWEFQNGWNMGDGVAVYSGTSSAYRTIYQEDILTVNSKYRLTFDIVSIASGSIENISQSSPTSYNTVGTKTEDFIATSTDLFLKPTTDADLTIDNISLIEVTDDTDLPRINYTDGEGSLKLEPQSTNLVTYSEDFSQWTKQSGGTGLAPIITSNNAISPDGTQNADKIVFNKGTGVSTSDLSIIASNSFTSQSNTTSFYIKADSPQKIVFRNSSNWQLVDVTTEWQRINKTDTGTGVQIGLRDGYGISGVPNTATVYLWGAQAEALSYATSYIPTEGSIKTRLADVCNNAGSSDLINSTEGVLYFEGSALADDGDDKEFFLSDGTMNNYVAIGYSRFAGNISAEIVSNGVLQTVNWGATGVNKTNNNKFALSWGSGTMKFYVNGTQTNTESVTSPTGLNVLEFNTAVDTSVMYANVKCVAVFKEALSDTELQKLTQV